MKEQQLLPQVIYSNSKEIVEQQRYIFETLWVCWKGTGKENTAA
jgi:hypothetical protein